MVRKAKRHRRSARLELFLPWGRAKNLEREFGLADLFHGGFIGIVTLEEVMPFDEGSWRQWQPMHLDKGEYQPGFFAWILSHPIRFKQPITGLGKTLLFPVHEAIEKELKQALSNR